MNIICALLSLPVSIILIRWLMRCKKENPFVKGNVSRLVIAGILSGIVGSIVTGIFLAINAVRLFGLDNLVAVIQNPENTGKIMEIINDIQKREISFAQTFVAQLIAVGFAEELSRYFFLRMGTRKQAFAKTWLDYTICGGIVGTGFTIIEDLFYSSGGVITTIFRSLMPFHFMYGAIMGYFVGKAIETGQKKYYVPGIMIPVLLHTLFDSSLHAIGRNDLYIILAAVMFIVSIGVTAFMIVKINRWSKAAAEKIAAEE